MEATSPHFSNDFWHCGVTSDAFSGIDSVAKTGIDKNDPRLRALGDKWNLDNCNSYDFPDLDTPLVTP